MKSFSGDEGYQAPCSPCLIELESNTANYVVYFRLVSAVLSRGVQSGRSAKEEKKTKQNE